MGRHKRHPTDNGNVKRKNKFGDTENVHEDAKDRIGLNNLICSDCHANNPEDADKCRKCGCKNLRRRRTEFRSG